MCQGDFARNIWGLGGGSFQRGAGELGDGGGEGHFQPLGEASQTVLRLLGAHRFLPPLVPHLCLRLEVSLPGVIGVPMKVIVIQGELAEMIQDVSGRP